MTPCERDVCTEPHDARQHLDPTSDRYDGPNVMLGALPAAARKAGAALLHASRTDNWQRRTVDVALHEMGREILRLRDQVAAVQVDRDRGICEAMKRAEDCAVHGEMIRFESHQAYWFSVQADQLNEERVVWLSAATAIRDAFKDRDDDIARKVIRFLDVAAKDAERARRRQDAPSHADCQRVGRCEHPATVPHQACEQLALDFVRTDFP